MEGLRTWSVGLDDGVVTASLPETLRFPSGPIPEWMGRCASAIRDALRELPVMDGTVLEATLAGVPPGEADLGDALLFNARIPEAQVYAGVRLALLPAAEAGVIQRYRRAPASARAGQPEETEETVLAALQVPVAGVFEIDSARLVWLAVRRVAVATLPAAAAATGAVEVRVRLATGSDRERGSTELIKKLLDGIGAAFELYAAGDPEEIARRLAPELRAEVAEIVSLLTSPRGVVLAAGERFAAAEILVVAGTRPQLDIELLYPGPA